MVIFQPSTKYVVKRFIKKGLLKELEDRARTPPKSEDEIEEENEGIQLSLLINSLLACCWF